MTTKMFAATDAQGTAEAATAVCITCIHQADPATMAQLSADLLDDCTGNESLDCQLCGIAGALTLPPLNSGKTRPAADDRANVVLAAMRGDRSLIRADGTIHLDALTDWRDGILHWTDRREVTHQAAARWPYLPDGIWGYRDREDAPQDEVDAIEDALDQIAHSDLDTDWCPECQEAFEHVLHASKVIDRLLRLAAAA